MEFCFFKEEGRGILIMSLGMVRVSIVSLSFLSYPAPRKFSISKKEEGDC